MEHNNPAQSVGYYWLGDSLEPAENLAIEEYFYRMRTDIPLLVMLWRNNPAVVVGKHQNPWREANVPFLEKENIPLVRRISGGGTVFHDAHNLNFTVIKNREPGAPFNLAEFTEPIHRLLNSWGIATDRSERGDVLVQGKKVCGTAQAETNTRLLYHGCLLFNTQLERLHAALHGGVTTIDDRSVSSVRSEVSNIAPHLSQPMEVETFKQHLLQAFIRFYGSLQPLVLTSSTPWVEIGKLKEKYTTWEWNFGQTPRFSVVSERSIASNCLVTVQKGRVTSVENDLQHPFLRRRFDPQFML